MGKSQIPISVIHSDLGFPEKNVCVCVGGGGGTAVAKPQKTYCSHLSVVDLGFL